jgi:hypothetical protein
VTFYETAQQAQNAGYRACKRCRPEQAGGMPEEAAVRKIRAFVAEYEKAGPGEVRIGSLRQMAEQTGLSKWHFHRVFKQVLGMTPKEWLTAAARRLEVPPSGIPTDVDLDKYFAGLDWDFFDGLDTVGSDESARGTYPTPGSSSDASLLFESPLISYTIRRTLVGFVLLAYQTGRLCVVHSAPTESEVMTSFNDAFPAFLYRHAFFDGTEGICDDQMHRHATAIVAMLERPISEM